MKPRKPAAHLTREDFDIFNRMGEHYAREPKIYRGHVAEQYFKADRRDAELMWEAQLNRGCVLFRDECFIIVRNVGQKMLYKLERNQMYGRFRERV